MKKLITKSKTITLYHYTALNKVEKIMKEGLKGGMNQNGTVFDSCLLDYNTPTLCLTAVYRSDNEKYGGYPLEVEVPEEKVEKIFDDLWIMKGEGVLIDPEDIKDLFYEFEMGNCSESIFCCDCEQRKNCCYFN